MTKRATQVLCLGGATVDRSYDLRAPHVPATSNPASGRLGFGGVARNVAENLARLGTGVSMFSIVGDDPNGHAIAHNLTELGIDASGLITLPGAQSAEYVAIIEPDGELVTGLANMNIFDQIDPAHLARAEENFGAAEWAFFDCNLPANVIATLADLRRNATIKIACDGVSTGKIKKLPEDLSFLDLLFLNLDEARACIGADIDADEALSALIDKGVSTVVLTRGMRGASIAHGTERISVPALSARLVDVTGAGDALIAGTLSGLVSGLSLSEAVRRGTITATLTTESRASVCPELSLDLVTAREGAVPA